MHPPTRPSREPASQPPGLGRRGSSLWLLLLAFIIVGMVWSLAQAGGGFFHRGSSHRGRLQQIDAHVGGADSTIRGEFGMAPGERFSANLRVASSVDVRGWSDDSASVIAHFDPDVCGGQQLTMTRTSRGVEVVVRPEEHRDSHGCEMRLEVKVPRRSNLDLTAFGGDFTIDDVSGNISGKTMGGDLHLSRITGAVHLATMGGEVELRQSHASGSVTTMGGDVLFEDVTGAVKATTMGGDVVRRQTTGAADTVQRR